MWFFFPILQVDMFRSLRKAASSLERTVGSAFDTAFSTTPESHAAFVNTTLSFPSVTVKLGPVIAEGGFSFVHIAKPVYSSQTQPVCRYAVKRLVCHDVESKRLAQLEISILSSLPPHPNIVPFHGAVHTQGHAFLLFDLVDGGSLPERLKTPLSLPNRSTHVIIDMFFDTVSAIAHLHAQNPCVAMRDVKLENVLYDRLERRYKLCDFGSVTTTTTKITNGQSAAQLEEEIGKHCTAMYRAPELADIYSSQFICERVDVWALGCVLHAMMFDSLPFDGSSSLAIRNGLTHIPESPAYPPYLINILRACLTTHPAERPDSFEVYHALCRINQREMPHELAIAADRLRTRRRLDFDGRTFAPIDLGILPEIPGTMSSSSNTSKHILSTDLLYETGGDVNDDDNDDWADFATAFATPSTKANFDLTLDHDPSLVQPRSDSTHRSVFQRTANPSSTGDLLDFSDGFSSLTSTRGQHPKHMDTRDLIDFSEDSAAVTSQTDRFSRLQ